ncbi:P-loop containing nucleoside triphosphate hydrolase protein [Suillus paluster]|uniref:P-loop containing nucleoside triphosphate hydrolase protein n=1 Tax=Suillus paluster TaxID=48578 RepID=UPI001B8726BA|nr:P-loop containing nucleoside triphosphate hydrolase protein [Suillus paluster]KAG1747231.1 P-loop containing nucleoside triphosphate hydrolase protein [Suillus paluster]
MSHTIITLQQNIYNADHDPILVEDVDEHSVSLPALQRFINSTQGRAVGVAATYRTDCTISCLAFATLTRALVVHFFPSKKSNPQRKKKKKAQEEQPPVSRGRTLIQDQILCDAVIKLYGYRIDRIALGLFLDLSLRINAAVDILSVSNTKSGRRSLQAIMDALGGETLLQKANVKTLFGHRGGHAATNDVVLQAWAACRAATLPRMTKRYAALSRIATDTMPDLHLSALAKISRDAEVLESSKPTKVVNNVKADFQSKKGSVNLECTHFRTRIMRGSDQVVRIETLVGDKKSTITGRALQPKGKQAQIIVNNSGVQASGKVLSVTTIGKGDLTPAESYKEDVVLKVLQGTITFTEHPFFCSIWAPTLNVPWPAPQKTRSAPFVYYPSGSLNPSQHIAVERILSQANKDRMVLIQGPPGTGKTTVIAASVDSIIKTGDMESTVWLVAHSNVAVKNIAEKLDKVGFREFKLLVSYDFHYDWHEHLYERLEHCFIRSDEISDDIAGDSRLLLDARVILCTLSMMSNLRIEFITAVVPVQTVIFDEASQIEVGDYLPLLQRFQHSLQKMVFIGDDKQLAPYGQDDFGKLQSIFEFPHLRKRAHFLNTQYRMPVVIGNFISHHVYANKLKTSHGNFSKTVCHFLDVKRGQQKKAGHSWINSQEIAVIIHLARIYVKQGKQYRILTPYDAQRTEIEKQLKLAELPWADKCFNVDSFQGKLFLDMLQDLADVRPRKRRRSHHRVFSPFQGHRVLEERAQDERHADALQGKHDHLHES